MSWFSSASEWKQSLSSVALGKVEELENQVEKLKKERVNKQNQLDTLQQALDKQKLKTEEEVKQKQTLVKEVEHLALSCDQLQEKLQRSSQESHLLDKSCKDVSPDQSLRQKILELESENKKLYLQLNESQTKDDKTSSKLNDTSHSSIVAHEDDFWSHFSRSTNAKEYQQVGKSPFKVGTAKKALETSEANPFRTVTTPVKTAIQTSDENPFKVPMGTITPFKNDPLPEAPFKTPQKTKSAVIAEHTNELLKELQGKIESYKTEIADLKHQLAAASSSTNEAKDLVSLKTALETSRSAVLNLEKQLGSANDDVALFKSKTEEANAKVEACEQKLSTIQSEMECQRHNNEAARKHIEDKSKEREKEFLADIAQLQSALSETEQQIKFLNTKLSQQETHALSVQNALQGTIDKMTAQLSSIEKEKGLSQSLANQFESQVVNLQKVEEENSKVIGHLKQEKQMLSSQVDTLKVKLAETEGLCKKLQSRLDFSEQDCINQKASYEESLSASKSALEKENENLKSALVECDAEKRKNDDLQSKINHLQTQIGTFNSKLEALKLDKEQAIELAKKVEEECQEKLTGVNTLEAAKAELEDKLSQALEANTRLKEEFEMKLQNLGQDAENKVKATREEMEKTIEELNRSSSATLEDIKASAEIDLKRLKEEKNAEIKELKEKMLESTKMQQDSKKNEEKAKEEKLAAELTVWELEGRLETATKDYAQHLEEKKAFEEKIKELNTLVILKEGAMLQEKDLKEKAMSDLETLSTSLATLKQNYSLFEKSSEDHKSKLELELSKLKEIQTDLQDKIKELESAAITHLRETEEIQSLNFNLREEMKKQDEILQEKEVLIASLKDEIESSESKLSFVTKSNEHYQEMLKETQAYLDILNTEKKTHNEDIDKLQEMLKEADLNNRNLASSMETANSKLSQELKHSQDKDNSIFLLQRELVEAKEKLQSLEENELAYEDSQEKLKAEKELANSLKAQTISLETKNDQLDYELFEMKQSNKELGHICLLGLKYFENAMETTEEADPPSEDNYEALINDLKSLKSRFNNSLKCHQEKTITHTNESQQLKEANHKQATYIQELDGEMLLLKTKLEELSKLEQEYDDNLGLTQSLEAQIKQIANEKINLQKENTAHLSVLAKVKKDCMLLSNELALLKSNYAELQKEFLEAQEEKTQLRSSSSSLDKLLQTCNSKLSQENERCFALQKEVEALRLLSEERSEIKKLLDEREAQLLEAEMDVLGIRQELDARIKELSTELDSTKECLAQKESKISLLEKEAAKYRLSSVQSDKNLQKEVQAKGSLELEFQSYREVIQLINKHISAAMADTNRVSISKHLKRDSTFQEERAKFSDTIFHLQKQNLELRDSVRSLTELKKTNSVLYKQLSKDLLASQEKVKNYEKELSTLHQQTKEYVEKIKELMENFDAQKSEFSRNCLEEVSALNKSLANKEDEIVDMGEVIQDLSSQLEKVKSEKAFLVESCTCRSKLEEGNASGFNDERESLEQENRQLQDELLQTKADLQRVKEQKDLNITLAEEYEEKVIDLQKKLEELELEKNRIIGELNSCCNEFELYKGDVHVKLSSLKEEMKSCVFEKDELSQLIKKMENSDNELNSQFSHIEAENKELLEDLKVEKNKRAALELDIEEERSNLAKVNCEKEIALKEASEEKEKVQNASKELISQIECLRKDNHAINRELKDLLDKEATLNLEIQKQLQEKESSLLKIKSLDGRIIELENALREKEIAIESASMFEEKAEHFEKENKEISTKLSSLQSTIQRLENSIANLTSERDNSVREISRLKKDLLVQTEIMDQFKSLEEESSSMKEMIKNMNNNLDDYSGKNEKLIELNLSYQIEVRELQERLESTRDQLQETTAQRDALSSEKDHLLSEKEEVLAKTNELIALKQRLLAEKDKLSKEKEDLLSENVHFNQLQKGISEQNEFLKSRQELSMKEIESFKEKLQQLEVKYKDIQKENTKYERQISTLNKSIAENESLIKEAQLKGIEAAKREEETKKEALDSAAALKKKSQELLALEAELEQERNQLSSIKMASQLQDLAIEKLKESIQTKDGKIASLEEELSTLRLELSQKETQMKALEEAQEKNLKEVEAKEEEFQKTLKDARDSLEMLRHKLSLNQTTLHKKDKELSSLQKRCDDIGQDNKKLKEKVKASNKLVKEAKVDSKKAFTSAEEWIAKFNQKSTEYDKLCDAHKETLGKVASAEDALKDSKDAASRSKVKVKKLEEEISKYRKQLTSLKENSHARSDKGLTSTQILVEARSSENLASSESEGLDEIGPSQSPQEGNPIKAFLAPKSDGNQSGSCPLMRRKALRLSRRRSSRGSLVHSVNDLAIMDKGITALESLQGGVQDSPIASRVKRLSRSQSSDSSGRSGPVGGKRMSSVDPPATKRRKGLNQRLEGLPHKIQEGLNNIPTGHDIVVTRPTTPLKQKSKDEKMLREPLNLLSNNNSPFGTKLQAKRFN